jgi:hypothetical protein
MKSSKYAKYDDRPGFVPEEDGHFTVTYLPIIQGFITHSVKRKPDLSDDQWVEVIHRNGDRSKGPVETFAWKNYDCHPNVRMDYILRGVHRDKRELEAYAIIDHEITHYRLLNSPPDNWVQGMPDWPNMLPAADVLNVMETVA